MVTPRAVADRFYSAFARRDADTMAACYADDARFADPAFPDLDAAGVRAMWRMLCARGKDLVIEHHVLDESGDTVTVHWDARYTFSGTGRAVHNEITATMQVRDGLIVQHRDRFSFHRWAGQALGPVGTLLGWTPFLRKKVQAQAAAALARYRAG